MVGNHLLPNWLYESLPYSYGGFGSVTAYHLDSGFGQMAGAVLIVAGLLVGLMRLQHRRSAKQAGQFRPTRRDDGIRLRHYRD